MKDKKIQLFEVFSLLHMPLFVPSVLLFLGRYEYPLNFGDSQSSDGSAQAPAEFGTNMVYYYNDGNKFQMYAVDEKLLKEYIKRQM